MKKPLTIISNIAPRYRESVYRLINGYFDCTWIFGENKSNIKSCDATFMTRSFFLQIKKGIKNFYWLKGALKKLNESGNTNSVLMLGEVKFLTSWIIMIANKLRLQKKRRKIVLWTHGWRGDEKGLQKWITGIYFRLADKVLFYGERGRKLGIKNGLRIEQTDVIHNSLNHNLFLKLRKDLESGNLAKENLLKDLFADTSLPLFVYIGRLSGNKKLDQVIKALHQLNNQNVCANLLFIGNGEDKEKLRTLSARLSLEKSVCFMDECYDEKATAPYIYLSDACISPGNIGLTVVHSMELGTPAITHNDMCKQVPEAEIIADGNNGYLFEPDNIEHLAVSMKKAIDNNSSRRDDFRRNCYEAVASWTPEYQFNVIRSAFE